MLSGSVPIRATLFREWHDSRLVAWKHFVPFDVRGLNLYGIMECLLGVAFGDGYGGKGERGRDELEGRIEGKYDVLKPGADIRDGAIILLDVLTPSKKAIHYNPSDLSRLHITTQSSAFLSTADPYYCSQHKSDNSPAATPSSAAPHPIH